MAVSCSGGNEGGGDICICNAGRAPEDPHEIRAGDRGDFLGSQWTDSLDARGDYKYTMDATSQTDTVHQAGINFSRWTLRSRAKGTGRRHERPGVSEPGEGKNLTLEA